MKNSGPFFVTASKVGGVWRPERRLKPAKSTAITIKSSRFCGFDGGRGFGHERGDSRGSGAGPQCSTCFLECHLAGAEALGAAPGGAEQQRALTVNAERGAAHALRALQHRDLAAAQPERVKELSATWDAWAKRCNVLPYPLPKK